MEGYLFWYKNFKNRLKHKLQVSLSHDKLAVEW